MFGLGILVCLGLLTPIRKDMTRQTAVVSERVAVQ